MRAGHRILLALALLLAAGSPALAQTAADREVPAGLTKTARSANFLVHYTTTGPDRTAPAAARLFLRAAELGLDRLVRVHGLRRPLPDRDGLVDIYVHNRIGTGNVAQAGADDDRSGVPSSGYLEVDSDERDRGTLVHELAHVIQFGYGMGTEADWFLEGSAAWASAVLLGAETTDADFVTPISAPLLCDPSARCPGDGGYGAWRLWQSLTERFGPRFVAEVYKREGVLVRRSRDPSLTALRRALAARGSSLPAALQGYVEQSARAEWTHPSLAMLDSIAVRRAQPGEELTRTLAAGAVRVVVPMRPLSGRYVRITEAGEPACSASRMSLTVTPPDGSESVPSVLVAVGGSEILVSMTPAGGSFTAAFDWRACDSDAYVLLSNPDDTDTARVEVSAALAPA